jgi:Lon protease-like protein
MTETVSINFGHGIPLFPLPNVVLLPHATVPLHIFEQRYRRLVHDALDSAGLIAMASFKGDDWKQDYEGSPPLRDTVCIGHILRHHALDDGRYNLLLQGICRAVIVREVQQDPYRTALLRPIETQAMMEIDLSDERQRIESLLRDPMLQQLASVKAVANWITDEVPTCALVDLTIMNVCDDMEQRYRMLSEPQASARVSWLQQYLRQTRDTLAVAERFGPSVSDDGFHLN